MIDAVIARLKDRTALRSVDGAARLEQLMKQKVLPQGTHGAFVVPLGLRGGAVDVATGIFRQTVAEAVGVILMRNAWGDTRGDTVQDELDADITQTIAALAGWAPAPGPGVFQLSKGQLVGFERGAAVYQLDFSINTQLRITP